MYRSCPKTNAPQFFSHWVTELESCYSRWYSFELPSFYVLICKGSIRMTPLLQLFKMESTNDSFYKQHAVIEFLVAVKEKWGISHKWLSNVDGNAAVDRSTVSLRPKRVRNGKLGKVQLLHVLPEPETWWSWRFGTVQEWFSLMWCREKQQLTQARISACCKNEVFSLKRTCAKCCLSTIMQGLV